jgi:hypothetical protein
MSMTTVDNLEKNNHSSDWRVFNADDFSWKYRVASWKKK